MKKKRTLNQTWVLCLRMWRWIAKVWQTPRYRRYDVIVLKDMWLRKNGFRYIRADCFFCDYKGSDLCCDQACLGSLVNPEFNCCNDDYNYVHKPVEFYKELLRLNRIRKAKK
jgi:hypothetical protein